MRPFRRHAHVVPRTLLVLLMPVFRYSSTVNAYVLRVVGRRHGPLLRSR